MDVPDTDLPEPTETGEALTLEPWEQADRDGYEAIKAIAEEFATADPESEEQEAKPPVEEATGEGTDPPPTEETAEGKTPDPEERGMARLVEREVAIRQREEKLVAREAENAKRDARLAELESKAASYQDDFHQHLRLRPTEALKAAGHDPEHVVRLYLAEKMVAEGKPVPPALQSAIDKAEQAFETNRLRRDHENLVRQMEAERFVAAIEAGAHTYINQGISKDAPTVAKVAARHPARVHREIMDEIARDASSRSGKEPNAPVLTYDEAAKRVEARWAEFSSLLSPAPPDASTPQPPKTPAPTVKQGASTPAPKPPAKPLSARKPLTQEELERQAIEEGVAEFKRQQQARKPAQ